MIQKKKKKRKMTAPGPKEKPHRTSSISSVYFDPDSPIERKMSDLLPGDLMLQFSIDPDATLFKDPQSRQLKRRATDPVMAQFDPTPPMSRRASQVDPSYLGGNQSLKSTPLEIAKKNQMVTCFLVELSDCTVDTFSVHTLSANVSDSVVVRDGPFLRVGKILKKIKPEECDKEALQIVFQDKDGTVQDYIQGLTQIVSELAPSFAEQVGSKIEILNVEIVSYQARSLIRLKINNINDPMLADVIQKLIQVFMSPVEFYDDDDAVDSKSILPL